MSQVFQLTNPLQISPATLHRVGFFPTNLSLCAPGFPASCTIPNNHRPNKGDCDKDPKGDCVSVSRPEYDASGSKLHSRRQRTPLPFPRPLLGTPKPNGRKLKLWPPFRSSVQHGSRRRRRPLQWMPYNMAAYGERTTPPSARPPEVSLWNPGGRRGLWYGSYFRASFEPERRGVRAAAAGTWVRLSRGRKLGWMWEVDGMGWERRIFALMSRALPGPPPAWSPWPSPG